MRFWLSAWLRSMKKGGPCFHPIIDTANAQWAPAKVSGGDGESVAAATAVRFSKSLRFMRVPPTLTPS